MNIVPRWDIYGRELASISQLGTIFTDISAITFLLIKLLKGLNPSKALGPDELHPRVLKELATELGPVFAHLFSANN